MKSKRGFTLIELLAVIVILAIIALIAVPIVLNMIENARRSAAKSSTYGYIQAIDDNNELVEMNDDYDLAIEEIKGTNIPVSSINLNIKGKKPTSGTVTIANGRVSNATLCINNYTVTYNGTEASVGSKGCEGGSTPEPEPSYNWDKFYYINGSGQAAEASTLDSSWQVYVRESTESNKIQVCGNFENGEVCFGEDSLDVENHELILNNTKATTLKSRIEAATGTTCRMWDSSVVVCDDANISFAMNAYDLIRIDFGPNKNTYRCQTTLETEYNNYCHP